MPDEIEGNGFTVDLVTVEVGARGFIRYESFCCLNDVGCDLTGAIESVSGHGQGYYQEFVPHLDTEKLLV